MFIAIPLPDNKQIFKTFFMTFPDIRLNCLTICDRGDFGINDYLHLHALHRTMERRQRLSLRLHAGRSHD